MKKLANKFNADSASTWVGFGAAGVIWSNVDLDKLAQFDRGQIAIVLFGALIAGLGYLTNKGGVDGKKEDN